MRHLLGSRRRPSAAMIVAVIALLVAASGSAAAATALVNGDKLIAKNSLSGNRLRNRSVPGSKLKLSSLGTVPNAKHAATADNATTAAISKVTYVSSNFTVSATAPTVSGGATCPPGTSVTGGGASVADKSGATWLVDSYPNGKTGWAADVENNGTAPTTATVTAICAPAAVTAP